MRPGRTSILSQSEPVSSSELLVILPCATSAILALIVAHMAFKHKKTKGLAEREGFEPPIPVKVCRFSRPVPSTARPPLRLLQFYYSPRMLHALYDGGSFVSNRL